MLEGLDQQLFLFLNSINSPLLDHIMFAISGKVIWAPLYISILTYLGIKYRRKFLDTTFLFWLFPFLQN